ncbi:hypothetical protein WME76_22275 [Sorangium sp. So ce119]|uniref:hypothetical protein n=1 Tax=Sorangium sp. So ce119 TaxID=3133279 RepID=UPI003F63AACC
MPNTGMGCAYGLDLESGRLIWQTPCAPTTTVAIAAPGRFLIGHQGYGALDTHLYDGEGRQIQRWRTHGWTDLGPLCDGPWPCRDGGAGANPVK